MTNQKELKEKKKMEEKIKFETKKLVSKDGTIAHYLKIKDRNILHNEEGPAFFPKGEKKNAEYYLYGVKYTKAKWSELRKCDDIRSSDTVDDAKRGG